MRVRKNRFFLLLLLLLTSCSLFYSAEEKARRLAIKTAEAYFTYNYQDPESWMKSVQEEYFYQEYIGDRVLPTLAPYMAQYFIKSTAELESIEEYTRGVSEDESDIIIWKLVLQVTPAWPANGPPEFSRVNREELPWTNGETATVYAVAANRLGIWNLRLLSPSSATRLAGTLTSPTTP
jgi:hypothetical protein